MRGNKGMKRGVFYTLIRKRVRGQKLGTGQTEDSRDLYLCYQSEEEMRSRKEWKATAGACLLRIL